MQKTFLTILTFLFLTTSHAQDLVKDVSNLICKCVEKNKKLKDSALIKFCFEMAAEQVNGLPKSQAKLEKLFSEAHFYMQKNCNNYIELLTRIVPQKGDWIKLDSNLTSNLSAEECRQLNIYDTLYYLEHTGDTTFLTIKDGFWTENFQHGKYFSKCSFTWISDTDFEIEFIKSDHPTRSKFSKKGDKYFYRLVDKKDNYYVVTANYGDIWQQFKIYH